MTKFKNYITDSRYPQTNFEHITDIIKKDCGSFVKELKKNMILLFSGRDEQVNFTKKSVRKNRTPRDTPIEIHDFIDNWFNKKFGIRARSNTVFCSATESSTSDYGEAYIIFPIGNYTTISSNKVSDLYSKIETIIKEEFYGKNGPKFENIDKIWNRILTSDEKINVYKEIRKLLDESDYKKNNIKNNNVEIMLHCKEYYMLSSHFLFSNYDEHDLIKSL